MINGFNKSQRLPSSFVPLALDLVLGHVEETATRRLRKAWAPSVHFSGHALVGAAKAQMAAVATAAAFNAALGTGELSLAEGEEWMLTHDTKNKNLCTEGVACFDKNNHVMASGKKRAPQRKELHDRNCLQRRCLEVQDAIKKGHRVVRPKN